MLIQYSPELRRKYKKLNVRIQNSFKEKIQIFTKSPNDPRLKNHALKVPYAGLRSINITADYRAIYEEIKIDEEKIAYFSLLGTHRELYSKNTVLEQK